MDPFLTAMSRDANLPAAVLDLHRDAGVFHGQCDIERGRGWLVGALFWLGGFPNDGTDQPVRFVTHKCGPYWSWLRDFGGHKTQSRLSIDSARDCVREDLGHISIWLKPTVTDAGVAHEIVRVSLWGVPCPKLLLPRSSSIEWADEQGRYRFDISAKVPILGQLIRYRGWLTRDHENTAAT